MIHDLAGKIRRGVRKPPKVILRRVGQEISSYTERYRAPRRERRLDLVSLLKKTQQQSLADLWTFLAERPYCTLTDFSDCSGFERGCPSESQIIFERAQLALEHRVDLLGSGLIALGKDIDWHKDYKTNYDWPPNHIRDINYNNPERSSDVKFPWEVSRLQWLMPVGQAYLLTQDERYAESAKHIFLSWIKSNSYARSVNWACTMEVALRVLSWTWFFHVFNASEAWQDASFQERFLTCLYLHGDFTERHLECSDINGNHYTADAAGLVFSGLFWGEGEGPKRWGKKGWQILCDELPRQVFEDGVDFEASVPYHRLVLELFFLPVVYRACFHLETPEEYKERLCLMAHFSAAYSQPGETVPLWGDADDARALPFGSQSIHDHRYLLNCVGYFFKEENLLSHPLASVGECFWLFGNEAVKQLQQNKQAIAQQSCAFPKGGFYVMQNEQDHIFIDCGPLGLAGRGGHGHNDCLAFEAVLKGFKLISDCGAYVYTASYKERNLFRSTESHNTPCIDGQEINRFIRWDYLWTLHEDAKPCVEMWRPGIEYDYFIGTHTGYQRLIDSVTPKRTIILAHQEHALLIQDDILCEGQHEVSIPLHLAPDVSAVIFENMIKLTIEENDFILYWEGKDEWQVQIISARISPSYGVVIPTQKLVWKCNIEGNSQLKVCMLPMTLDEQEKVSLLSKFKMSTF